MVEQKPEKLLVGGSIPFLFKIYLLKNECIAQLVEQWPFKPLVLGSSPGATISKITWNGVMVAHQAHDLEEEVRFLLPRKSFSSVGRAYV